MRGLGLVPTSTWAEEQIGPENFAQYTVEQLRAIAFSNDGDILRSNSMLVLARPGAGGEMFAEARFALQHEKAVFWVGRRTLSAWRRGVIRCHDLDAALDKITHPELLESWS